MENLKDILNREIEKLNIQDLDKKEEIISSLYFIIYNKPYFNKRFKDFFVYKNHENKIRFTSPIYNDISGATRLHTTHFICQKDNNEKTESFYSNKKDLYYLKGSQRKNIISFYKLIKEKNDFKSFKKKFNIFIKNNAECLYDFELIFNHMADPNEYSFYNFLISNFKSKPLKNKWHKTLFEINNKTPNDTEINELNFEEVKYYYWKSLRKEMVKIRKINFLIRDNQYYISKILKEVYKIYPIILKKPNKDSISGIKYYLLEIPAYKEDSEQVIDFSTDVKLKLDKKGFSNLRDKSTFRDFVYYSPFMMNKNHQNTFNTLEGLIYINDFNLRKTKAFNQFFIVAKNEYNETIGVLSLHQPYEMNHFTKIGEVNIKHNYRKLGLAKKLYTKMAELAINNNLVITNRMYSDMGKKYLPKMKQQIIKENPELLLINANFGNLYDYRELNTCIENYNNFLINDIQIQDKMNTLNVPLFKKAYEKGLEYILDRSKYPEFSNKEAKEEALRIFRENNKKP